RRLKEVSEVQRVGQVRRGPQPEVAVVQITIETQRPDEGRVRVHLVNKLAVLVEQRRNAVGADHNQRVRRQEIRRHREQIVLRRRRQAVVVLAKHGKAYTQQKPALGELDERVDVLHERGLEVL